MREIKFRGQHIDTKEWVYGDLVQVINHRVDLNWKPRRRPKFIYFLKL